MNSAEAECRTGEVLEAVRKAFLKSFGAEPVFGISSFGSRFDELPDLQREAWELLREEEGSVDVQPKVAEAVRYLQEHYAENISLQSVADRLNVTPNYLGHLFVRFWRGRSPISWAKSEWRPQKGFWRIPPAKSMK